MRRVKLIYKRTEHFFNFLNLSKQFFILINFDKVKIGA